MIKPGETHHTKVYGPFRIKKVAELPKPLIYETARWGRTAFRPTIAKIEWKDGKKEFWFPYWIGSEGKEKYGQYAPMLAEKELLSLLREAIRQKFFSKRFMAVLADDLNKNKR